MASIDDTGFPIEVVADLIIDESVADNANKNIETYNEISGYTFRNKLGLSWPKLSSCWGLKLEFEVEA